LSSFFKVESVRDNQSKAAEFSLGELTSDQAIEDSTRRKGTKVVFIPDDSIFKNFKYRTEYVVKMLKNYVYLNPGLTIDINGEKFYYENGLKDLLQETISDEDMAYPISHLRGNDIKIAITHSKTQYSDEYHSF